MADSHDSDDPHVSRVRVHALMLPELVQLGHQAARERAAADGRPYSFSRYLEDALKARLKREGYLNRRAD